MLSKKIIGSFSLSVVVSLFLISNTYAHTGSGFGQIIIPLPIVCFANLLKLIYLRFKKDPQTPSAYAPFFYIISIEYILLMFSWGIYYEYENTYNSIEVFYLISILFSWALFFSLLTYLLNYYLIMKWRVVPKSIIQKILLTIFFGLIVPMILAIHSITFREHIPPLVYFARHGNKEAVVRLLKEGKNVDSKDYFGNTALSEASSCGYYEIIKTLIDKGADVNAKNKNGNTALMRASWRGRISEMKLLIGNGAKIDVKNKYGTTALIGASEANRIEVLKILLNRKININAGNNNGLTSLMVACKRGHIGVVRLIISYGADINIKDNEGKTALIWAVYRESSEIIQLLLDNSANINEKDELGKSPLMYASGSWFKYTNIYGIYENHIGDGRPQLVKLLLYHGANIDTRDKLGRTLLMHASGIRDVEVMRILLESGADINARDKSGKTVLSALNPDWKRNLKEVTMLLEQYGAKE